MTTMIFKIYVAVMIIGVLILIRTTHKITADDYTSYEQNLIDKSALWGFIAGITLTSFTTITLLLCFGG